MIVKILAAKIVSGNITEVLVQNKAGSFKSRMIPPPEVSKTLMVNISADQLKLLLSSIGLKLVKTENTKYNVGKTPEYALAEVLNLYNAPDQKR